MKTSQLLKGVNRLGDPRFWESLNPELSITNFPFMKSLDLLGEGYAGADYVQQMKNEGYFLLDSVLPAQDTEPMAQAMARIVELGLPPIFAFVYDEFWQIYYRLSPLLSPIFGENYRIVENQWAWLFPPTANSAGFEPHRDGDAVDYEWFPAGTPIQKDGLPALATVWIPLTDVTPLNSCMYVLPTNKDPDVPGKLESESIGQESISSIRALPCKAGSVLSWNTNVLHWGSKGSDYATDPRISFATFLISDGLPKTHKNFSLASAQPLSLAYRLRLIGMNMYTYGGHLMNCPPPLTNFCELYKDCRPEDVNFTVNT